MKEIHYRYRGWIAGIIAVSALASSEGAPWSLLWIWSFLLLGLGLVWRVWARRDIGDHSRGLSKDAPDLIQTGAYAACRHPLYISSWWVGVSWLSVQQWSWILLQYVFVFLWTGHLVLMAWSEDRYLREKFGSKWLEWSAKTPFWSWLPFGARLGNSQSWSKDLWTWIWIGLAYGLAWFRSGF